MSERSESKARPAPSASARCARSARLRSGASRLSGRLNLSVAERIGEAAEMKRPPQPCSTPAHAPAPAPCDVSRETDAGGSRGPSGRARPQGAGGGDDPDRRHRTGGLDPFTQTIRAPGPRGWLGSRSATAPSRPRGHGTERTPQPGSTPAREPAPARWRGSRSPAPDGRPRPVHSIHLHPRVPEARSATAPSRPRGRATQRERAERRGQPAFHVKRPRVPDPSSRTLTGARGTRSLGI